MRKVVFATETKTDFEVAWSW